ncbi:MAG: hypothetical protein ABSB35_26415 [Bryobacteraceae bacterium]|jgi:hypothetical protein
MNVSQAPERRRAPRTPSSGSIQLSFEDPAPVTLEAELVESSSTGFRAAHEYKNLTPGIIVEFRRESAAGRARVIWTHVLDGRRISGFHLL